MGKYVRMDRTEGLEYAPWGPDYLMRRSVVEDAMNSQLAADSAEREASNLTCLLRQLAHLHPEGAKSM